jgi:hypothetical protein
VRPARGAALGVPAARAADSGGRPGRPGPPDCEKHQDHQAERNARDRHAQACADEMAGRVLGGGSHDNADDHENGAEHGRHSSRDREGDDQPHPPDGGGIGAHCSTIAS